MASLTQWTWVWVNYMKWWRVGKLGMLQFMESHRVRHDWVTEQQWQSLWWHFPLEYGLFNFPRSGIFYSRYFGFTAHFILHKTPFLRLLPKDISGRAVMDTIYWAVTSCHVLLSSFTCHHHLVSQDVKLGGVILLVLGEEDPEKQK